MFNNDSPSFDPNFFENKSEIENSLYDEEFTINDDDGKVGYRQIGFFREENIEFISKIGVYRLNFSENCRTTRRFYEPFKTPYNKISSELQPIFNDYYKIFGRFYEPLKTPLRKMSPRFERNSKMYYSTI